MLDIVVVGDRVEFELNTNQTGTISKILERKNYLSRKAPKIKGASFRGERLEQIIASNIDQVLIVASVDEPKFNNRIIDRFLVIAESSAILPIIIINKYDLDNPDVDYFEKMYSSIGYQVIKTSVVKELNLDKVHQILSDKISIFWGASGVGKSSLIKKIFPQFDIKIGDISSFSNKGKHTTVTSQMLQLSSNSFIIDTPGVREIEPFGIQKKDLSHYFIEFQKHRMNCKFNTCSHDHEPNCGVIEAVGKGEISRERYQSYINILNSVEDDILF